MNLLLPLLRLCLAAIPLLKAPTEVSFSWENKSLPGSECQLCCLKLRASQVPGATVYDWVVEAENTHFTKSTHDVHLPGFLVKNGDLTVKVRARNAAESSEYFVKTWKVELPQTCCVE